MRDNKWQLERSKTLQKMQLLFPRMTFSKQEKQIFHKQMKGYHGENKFYNLLKYNLPENALILNDLLLKSNHSLFQIDHLLVNANTIFHFEIKNFEGEYYINNNLWYVKATQKEIRNPLLQLEKSSYLLRHLVQQLGYNIRVKSYLVFINPEFTLFQLPLNLPIIMPTQLNRFVQKLNRSFSPPSQEQQRLVTDLEKLNNTHSSFEQIPNYTFKKLKKGILCPTCFSFLDRHTLRTLICKNCGFNEIVKHAILRNIKEFNLLFPNKNITTNIICEWCGNIFPKSTIRKVLSKNLILVKTGRHSYYDIKNIVEN